MAFNSQQPKTNSQQPALPTAKNHQPTASIANSQHSPLNIMEHFNFENLEVWQKAVEFADDILELIDNLETNRRHYRLLEQMDSACTGIAMNIAEGKGRFSEKEFIHFLHIARGSLFETVTLLIIFEKRKWIDKKSLENLKQKAFSIGKMINALINAIKKSY